MDAAEARRRTEENAQKIEQQRAQVERDAEKQIIPLARQEIEKGVETGLQNRCQLSKDSYLTQVESKWLCTDVKHSFPIADLGLERAYKLLKGLESEGYKLMLHTRGPMQGAIEISW